VSTASATFARSRQLAHRVGHQVLPQVAHLRFHAGLSRPAVRRPARDVVRLGPGGHRVAHGQRLRQGFDLVFIDIQFV
jgi:hypothetical protein